MPPLLTEAEYKATMGSQPISLGLDEEPPFDFWPYCDSIAPEDLGDHDFSAGIVAYVFDMPGRGCQHVAVACETPNVFLVLVLDLNASSVLGHHLLDLNRLYGLA
ncbi:hypothetical protein DFJ67_4187 [Asanoa ferruginea]|uniref:Uncharacterized protein n=1 Tax=Asanoa ferruginea TaxID=53367 RepID=A0A3D9ZLT9_9ACTN|nr:hypothetical protein [Asanoa ferruginea]REF98177.1 hypothetical protein DFJ67_4187 [Asanoa ferruginea]GIF50855.1 hypothetical protein Afe04nite_53940 [Asanoa ferruginea]